MKLRRISVKNVRNHKVFACDLSDTTSLIYGKNGAGKTAILEAISIAYRGKSFRGSDRDIVRNTEQWYRIDVEDDSGYLRYVTYDARQERPAKRFVIDEKAHGRLPQKEKYPIVLFTPDDLRMIDGSPTRRRDYLDYVISQYDAQYDMARRRYERTLLQRNKLLKQSDVTVEQLFSWNIILAETGAVIINARVAFADQLDDRLDSHYRRISSISDDIHVRYTHAATTAQTLLGQYEDASGRDLATGSTSVGPHRHDMIVTLRGRLAADVASRGETRTIILAIKFIEAELFYERFETHPLVLLDDVYGELDSDRRHNLSTTLEDNQIIITSTDKIDDDTKQINL